MITLGCLFAKHRTGNGGTNMTFVSFILIIIPHTLTKTAKMSRSPLLPLNITTRLATINHETGLPAEFTRTIPYQSVSHPCEEAQSLNEPESDRHVHETFLFGSQKRQPFLGVSRITRNL